MARKPITIAPDCIDISRRGSDSVGEQLRPRINEIQHATVDDLFVVDGAADNCDAPAIDGGRRISPHFSNP